MISSSSSSSSSRTALRDVLELPVQHEVHPAPDLPRGPGLGQVARGDDWFACCMFKRVLLLLLLLLCELSLLNNTTAKHDI